jgi:predicted esterase
LVGWGERLAARGYAALAFSTQPEGLDNVPRYVANCKSNLEIMLSFVFNQSAFPITVDPDSVSLMGMSGGGASVLSIDDERIKTTIAVCPYYVDNTTAVNTEPVLIITGQNDYIAPHVSHGAVYYDELMAVKMIIEQANTPEQDGHDIFETGWKYTFAWLEYNLTENPDAYYLLENVETDMLILESLSDLPEP